MSNYLRDLYEMHHRANAPGSATPASHSDIEQLSCWHRELRPFQLHLEAFQAKGALRLALRDLPQLNIAPGHRHLTFTSPCNELNPSFEKMTLQTCEQYIYHLRTMTLCQQESHQLSQEDLNFEGYSIPSKLLCVVQGYDMTIDVRWEHCEGYIHSAYPDVMIWHGGNAGLATSLYFKQCDGTYVNALGELKRMRYGDRRTLGVDLLLRDELHNLFDLPTSWTDDLDGDELWLLYGKEQSGYESWC